jgi:predicted RNase H-like nuclease (RuvC/YqgF family)
LNTETVDINRKAKTELEKKKIMEKQLCTEAQNLGMKIEEKQKKITDLKLRVDDLKAKTNKNTL